MKRLIAVVVVFACVSLSFKSYALEAVEIFSGYFQGELDDTKKDYTGVPLLVSFDFDLKPLISKVGITPKGRVNFIIEPFINTIIKPNDNLEAGGNFLFKYTFPLTDFFQPYIKGGLGFLYMSTHTLEQSTQYNGLPQAGGGFHLFFKENIAFSCEYRYRHLSNGSIKDPNRGIDVEMFLAGISIFFK